jgi:hypothetical protein
LRDVTITRLVHGPLVLDRYRISDNQVVRYAVTLWGARLCARRWQRRIDAARAFNERPSA